MVLKCCTVPIRARAQGGGTSSDALPPDRGADELSDDRESGVNETPPPDSTSTSMVVSSEGRVEVDELDIGLSLAAALSDEGGDIFAGPVLGDRSSGM